MESHCLLRTPSVPAVVAVPHTDAIGPARSGSALQAPIAQGSSCRDARGRAHAWVWLRRPRSARFRRNLGGNIGGTFVRIPLAERAGIEPTVQLPLTRDVEAAATWKHSVRVLDSRAHECAARRIEEPPGYPVQYASVELWVRSGRVAAADALLRDFGEQRGAAHWTRVAAGSVERLAEARQVGDEVRAGEGRPEGHAGLDGLKRRSIASAHSASGLRPGLRGRATRTVRGRAEARATGASQVFAGARALIRASQRAHCGGHIGATDCGRSGRVQRHAAAASRYGSAGAVIVARERAGTAEALERRRAIAIGLAGSEPARIRISPRAGRGAGVRHETRVEDAEQRDEEGGVGHQDLQRPAPTLGVFGAPLEVPPCSSPHSSPSCAIGAPLTHAVLPPLRRRRFLNP